MVVNEQGTGYAESESLIRTLRFWLLLEERICSAYAVTAFEKHQDRVYFSCQSNGT